MKLYRECSLPATSLHFGGEGRVSTFYAPSLDNRTGTDKKWGYSTSFTLQTSVPKPLSSQPTHLSHAHQVWAPLRLLPFNLGGSFALGGLPRKAVPTKSQEPRLSNMRSPCKDPHRSLERFQGSQPEHSQSRQLERWLLQVGAGQGCTSGGLREHLEALVSSTWEFAI